ncbi:uncharacterized protein LOC110712507 [Chenopodium quinoa]|uniref:uncharacterized protein LOC110712507 n=1 Tax=Chenopodium quinoa TaxID=63459 RepID=UPI000B76CC16|nr:uncharacterized protein LOC110712507 [Chenopodium quinoa]
MLVSWILRAIDPKVAASIPYFEEAKKLWDYLEKRFCEASGPRLEQLLTCITNCKQSKAMTVEEYYTTLMGFFYDLLRLKPPHGCECGKCSCNVAAKYESDREEEKLHQFLIGIDDDKYAMVRTNLLSQQPPTTLDRAYHAFLQEERSRGIAQGHAQPGKVEAHVFALPSDRRSLPSTSRVDKSKLYCTHCKRTGHDNTGCFILHGYPEWWLEKYGKKGGASSSVSRPAAASSLSAAAPSFPPAPATAVTDHSKPKPRANAVGTSLVSATSLPSQGTLSALLALQPEHVRLLLTVQLSGNLIGDGERIDGLYYFRRLPRVCAVTNPEISTFELWHRRLGHPSDHIVKLVPAISASSSRKSLNKACDVCPQAKQSRDSFPNSDSRDSRIFELIHCDLWGPYKTPSTCGAHYFLTIVDDFSRGVWVYLLNDKTEVYSSFCSFFAMVKCQFDVHVKYVRSDNGTEFKPMLPYFSESGILFQTSCAGTPQQNGRVERKHQHILNAKGDKFSPRSRKCAFVGYPHGKKGWKVYDLETVDIFVSSDVKFFENEFPFLKHDDSSATNVGFAELSNANIGVDNDFLDDLEFVLKIGKNSHVPDIATHSPAPHTPDDVASPASPSPARTTAPVTDPAVPLQLGRGQRPKNAPGWHRDYVAHTVSLSSPSITPSSPSTPGSSGTPYPLAHFVNCNNFSLRHRVFIAAVDTMVEPRNFNEVMQHEGWKEAMRKEITAPENNETWVMEKIPPGKKALGCRWVYKVKLNSDGTIERWKARLVIFGNNQVEGIDYNKTFAPVAKMVTVRAFLAVAAAKNWELHQMDVHNAFLPY